MRVLQINAVYGSKSTGLITRDIHHTLLDTGNDSFVAHPGSITDKGYEISIGNRFDYAIHAVLTRLFGIQGLASSVSTRLFLKKLKKTSPDIIHLHNIHSNFLNYKILLSYTAKNNIPVIVTLHDCWFFTGKCYHFLDVGCEKYKTGCHNCPKRKKDIPSLFIDNSCHVYSIRKKVYLKNSLHIVGCSKWITECARQSPLLENARFYQIYNGVDISAFKPYDRKHHPFTILTMANKWYDPANENARNAVLEMLEESERVIVIGCNTNSMSDSNPKVETHGYISDREELAKYYSMSDVFLNLTFVDTLPTVNMEALACGTPVITYNSGGSGELVDSGVTGYVVQPNNIEKLRDSLCKVRSGMIDRNTCRSYAITNFDKETNYMKYIDLYVQCIQERGK